MIQNQRGNTLFWVLSVILAIALILILALSGKYNLDPEKNVDDCTTNMKNIWVAVNDYMLDNPADFSADLDVLRNTRKPDSKTYYLPEEKYCPESQGKKDEYQVFGKHVTEVIDGETRHYNGILILCPNLGEFSKHVLDKAFYDNMSISKLQNVMINDLSKIEQNAKSNAKLKAELMQKYFDYWKNNNLTDFQACIDDPAYQSMRIEVTGETPVTEEEF